MTRMTVPRRRAAELLGLSAGTLKNWALQNPIRGPEPIKLGAARQSRTLYRLDDLTAWLADPIAYERRRSSHRGPRS